MEDSDWMVWMGEEERVTCRRDDRLVEERYGEDRKRRIDEKECGEDRFLVEEK